MTGETFLPEWAWALGRPPSGGIIRTEVEDFRVSELPLAEYSRAKRFLSSIAYEAAKPAEPAPALAMQP